MERNKKQRNISSVTTDENGIRMKGSLFVGCKRIQRFASTGKENRISTSLYTAFGGRFDNIKLVITYQVFKPVSFICWLSLSKIYMEIITITYKQVGPY